MVSASTTAPARCPSGAPATIAVEARTKRGVAPMEIEVRAATVEEKPILANLLELYSHDFSEFSDMTIGDDGRFGYEPLDRYWSEPTRFPMLVRANGRLAGFVLVRRGSQISTDPDVWDVAEFFVLRGARGHRVGTQAAHAVWSMFAGRWEVRVMESNPSALAFWQRAVGEFVGATPHPARVDVRGTRWHVFSFTSDTRSEN